MTTIIGITGTKGVGKSSLATMLTELLPEARIVAFADALKSDVCWIVAERLYQSYDDVEAWLEAHKGTVYGPLLQGWGELMRQQRGENYWVELVASYLMSRDAPRIAIIPDVRYPNEAEFILSKGGLLVAIDGPCRWKGDVRSADHPSEASVSLCRERAWMTFINTFGRAHLRRFAKHVASRALELANHDKERAP